jgi:hypothetical protein
MGFTEQKKYVKRVNELQKAGEQIIIPAIQSSEKREIERETESS